MKDLILKLDKELDTNKIMFLRTKQDIKTFTEDFKTITGKEINIKRLVTGKYFYVISLKK